MVHPSSPSEVQRRPSPSRAHTPGVDTPLCPVRGCVVPLLQSLPLRGLAGGAPIRGQKVLVSEELRDVPEDSIADPQRRTMGGIGGPRVGNSFCRPSLWGRLINTLNSVVFLDPTQ